jgi:phosphate starvation-inducible PhoH-like protein
MSLSNSDTANQATEKLTLEPNNTTRIANLCGRLDEHLKQIESQLHLKIIYRGNKFQIYGNTNSTTIAKNILETLYGLTSHEKTLTPELVHLALHEFAEGHSEPTPVPTQKNITIISTPKTSVKPRSPHQHQYVEHMRSADINFGVGPAGTGKTYLAVACAVEALVTEKVSRILLVRPAVEAGEKLGFLPGDLAQKVDPYLRPLYDALYEMLGFERVGRLIEKNIIEIAPLAYMRGRTLNNSFIILDESQNTTAAQMKMFLTRIGFGSTAVVTGDITQIDLPRGTESGLAQVSKILQNISGITFSYFDAKDVVRHRLVQHIVEAYDQYDQQAKRKSDNARSTIY